MLSVLKGIFQQSHSFLKTYKPLSTPKNMADFIWHKVSEQEKEDIRNNAKRILDQFANKLDKISVEGEHFSSGSGLREEGEPWKTPESFRETMLENAPDSDSGFIVAEKGGWK
jgi:Asp-tRNA(Asn)/Glu-tRNA(Gln) amidotransferase C subunit